MLDMKTGTWSSLPCMQEARAELHPCEFRGLLYLCGKGSALIEVFNPETWVFLPLSFILPEKFSACITVVDRCHLLVISEHYASWWAEEAGLLTQVSLSQHEKRIVTCTMTPVLDQVNDLVYFANEETCFSIRLDGSEASLVGR